MKDDFLTNFDAKFLGALIGIAVGFFAYNVPMIFKWIAYNL